MSYNHQKTESTNERAVILLSGGLDSTACLAYAKAQGFDCYALSFSYGQKNSSKLNAAKSIAAHFNAKHKIFDINIDQCECFR